MDLIKSRKETRKSLPGNFCNSVCSSFFRASPSSFSFFFFFRKYPNYQNPNFTLQSLGPIFISLFLALGSSVENVLRSLPLASTSSVSSVRYQSLLGSRPHIIIF